MMHEKQLLKTEELIIYSTWKGMSLPDIALVMEGGQEHSVWLNGSKLWLKKNTSLSGICFSFLSPPLIWLPICTGDLKHQTRSKIGWCLCSIICGNGINQCHQVIFICALLLLLHVLSKLAPVSSLFQAETWLCTEISVDKDCTISICSKSATWGSTSTCLIIGPYLVPKNFQAPHPHSPSFLTLQEASNEIDSYPQTPVITCYSALKTPQRFSIFATAD